MSHSQPLSRQEIRRVARATAAALEEHGLKSCLFGSAACSMYGLSRVPNDVDIVVLNLWSNWDAEDLKDLLVREHDRFYTTATRNYWEILWYRLGRNRRCKVDILVPGLLDIPHMPHRRITFTNVPDVPVMPLLAVILLKLKGWDDHRDDSNRAKREKQYVDAEDIDEMLDIAIEEGCHLRDERWMPKWFKGNAGSRLTNFVEEYPETREKWEEIGLRG